ncbi:MAG TPA: GAF domain-containing protein, partial [Candidatus Obscuribacterales bacterium]
MQRSQPEAVTLNDILITEELSQRAPRSPNLQAENQAMRLLVQRMAQGSESLMQTLADVALELCQAGTAGLSLLDTPDGEEIFRWNILAGTLAHHVGRTTPRNFSPCGVCLDQGTPVLFSHPASYFTDLQEANTPVVEGLVLPLIADRHTLGTIWIMSHDQQRQFDAEDVRIMTSLADFAATALLLNQQQTQELLTANARLSLVEERNRLALEAAELATWDWNIIDNRVIWNEQHYRLLGLEPRQGQETATLFTQCIHAEDLPQVNEQLEHAIATNGVYQA